jgi:hypothetical protein
VTCQRGKGALCWRGDCAAGVNLNHHYHRDHIPLPSTFEVNHTEEVHTMYERSVQSSTVDMYLEVFPDYRKSSQTTGNLPRLYTVCTLYWKSSLDIIPTRTIPHSSAATRVVEEEMGNLYKYAKLN